MPYARGRDAILYQANVELTRLVDVDLPKSADMMETTTRAAGTAKTYDYGLADGTISFTMRVFVGDSGVTALRNAYDAQATLVIKTTGGQKSEQATCLIQTFDEHQPLNDVTNIDVVFQVSGGWADV